MRRRARNVLEQMNKKNVKFVQKKMRIEKRDQNKIQTDDGTRRRRTKKNNNTHVEQNKREREQDRESRIHSNEAGMRNVCKMQSCRTHNDGIMIESRKIR